MTEARSQLDKTLYAGNSEFFSGSLELMGTWEVAAYLGVEKSRVARWVARGAVTPVARLKAGPLLTLEQVRARARQMYGEGGADLSDAQLDRWLATRRKPREARRRAAAAA